MFHWGFVLIFAFSALSFGRCGDEIALFADDRTAVLDQYEAIRVQQLQYEVPIENFEAKTGFIVTRRDPQGNATEGILRVLSDNAHNDIWFIGDNNGWGTMFRPEDQLHAVPGTPYYQARIRGIFHGMEYRLRVNGRQLLDPAATQFTPPRSYFLNSVFYDLDRPSSYRMQTHSVDLRRKFPIVAEAEVYQLAKLFPRDGGVGPLEMNQTYRFVAESGLIERLKQMGYNAIEFLPFNSSLDGDQWHLRYQVFGNFGPDSRYGTPDDFAYMVDRFNQAGIGVIMDAVVGHYPFWGNMGSRDANPVGIHHWTKADGQPLFGARWSPWGTYRYDYLNPYVRRFLIDGIMTMLQRYGISGVRFDNIDGIRFEAGGWEFIRELVTEIRMYRPECFLIGEMFFGENKVMARHDHGGQGINLRTNSTLFDFFKDSMQKRLEEIPMDQLKDALRSPWGWGEAPRINYITNHDEAANSRGGATGEYVASLLNGGGWDYVERKTKAFASLAMLSGTAYMDMPQLRLMQEGNFSHNPAVDWSLLQYESQSGVFHYFARLSNAIKDHEAFAVHNLHPHVENHVDSSNKVVSLSRADFLTGERFVAVISLNHEPIHDYQFGVADAGNYRIVVDSDRAEFRGHHLLANAVPHNHLHTNGHGEHGKSHSITLPVLPPYGVVLLEKIH